MSDGPFDAVDVLTKEGGFTKGQAIHAVNVLAEKGWKLIEAPAAIRDGDTLTISGNGFRITHNIGQTPDLDADEVARGMHQQYALALLDKLEGRDPA